MQISTLGGKVVASVGNHGVAGVPQDRVDDVVATIEANARLVAAAPDLLESAKIVLESAGLLFEAHGIKLGGTDELAMAVEKAVRGKTVPF